jgi:hypothetical protein
MIQANELRIGNVFNGASRSLEIVVNGRMIAQFEEGVMNLLTIPLTPEILGKCGAISNGNNWLLGRIELSYITTDKFFEFEYQMPSEYWNVIELRSLHQLQNLYFALTGEELTFTP